MAKKSFKKKYYLIISIFLLTNIALFSQDEPDSLKKGPSGVESVSGGIEGEISVDLRNISVIDSLKYLAAKAGINIVITEEVTGRVSLTVEEVPIKDVFDIILRSNGLAYDKKGEIYNVMTEQQYKILHGEKFGDIRETEVFRLDYGIPEQVFSLLDALKSDVGKVVVDPESGSVLVMDSPEKIKQMKKAIKTFDKKSIVKVFNLDYAKAEEVVKLLQNQLDAKKVGYIKGHPAKNQVIVQTLSERMKQVEEIISYLDQKTKEIFIDIKIVDVKITDKLEEKLEWEGLLQLANDNGLTYLGSTPFSSVQSDSDPWRSRLTVLEGGTTPDGTAVTGVDYVGSYPFSGTTSDYASSQSVVAGESLHFGMVGDHDFDTFYKFLKTVGETRIITTPQVVVANNEKAKIHVGEKQVYVTTTTTTGQSTSTVAEDVTFIDVGTMVSVTPFINEKGYITLDVSTELSSVVSELVTPTQNRIPIIGTTKAETKVMTKDGVTVVIGGLRRSGKIDNVSKVPFLGDIPLLGKAFRSNDSETERRELLIIMTPHIISGDILVAEGGPIGSTKEEDGQGFEVDKAELFEEEVSKQKLEFKGLK